MVTVMPLRENAKSTLVPWKIIWKTGQLPNVGVRVELNETKVSIVANSRGSTPQVA
ncbi:unnamed protein product [Nippostrongylus brasiliensis]|uniref:Reverse transcriptase domain-containing protein n=1 Tax=Nippostrongylus brasiliensis TaxID=27835 RepID=A0A0N4XR46_NIPBR|nr:unnamed protein product [Nippostrongylus brasiliensis]